MITPYCIFQNLSITSSVVALLILLMNHKFEVNNDLNVEVCYDRNFPNESLSDLKLDFLNMSKNSTFNAPQIESIPPPGAFRQEFPATTKQLDFVLKSRQLVTNILNGFDKRLLLIVGPCSIHDTKAAEEYATKLHHLSKDVSQSFLIVMRTYFEKPRTSLGWKGMIYDPHLNGSNNIVAGISQARKLLLYLADIELPAATEFLDPVTSHYIGDLISWACIGARTAESQIHRQFASGLPMPVAFKNSTTGNIDVAINGVLAALSPHTFFGIDDMGQISIIRTKGNVNAHIALRGGENSPNYDEASIKRTLNLMKRNSLAERIIVDCSHDNSCRRHEEQEVVFESVLKQFIDGNHAIRGLSVESHLFGGSQQISADTSALQYAVSLTDPCLDWDNTERLIRRGAKMMS